MEKKHSQQNYYLNIYDMIYDMTMRQIVFDPIILNSKYQYYNMYISTFLEKY